MTFKTCTEYYPIHETLVGNYWYDQSFEASKDTDIEGLREDPFFEDRSCYAFVVYNEEDDEFDCYKFVFYRVGGYINDSDDYGNFYPAYYEDDFGWTKIDPDNLEDGDMLVVYNDELPGKNLREQLAYLYDPELYEKGFIFTEPVSIKYFLSER